MSPDLIERARRRAGDDRLYEPRCECTGACDEYGHVTGRCHRLKGQAVIGRDGRTIRVDLTVATLPDGTPIAACQDCATGIERGPDV